jgi:hypothetical protein
VNRTGKLENADIALNSVFDASMAGKDATPSLDPIRMI